MSEVWKKRLIKYAISIGLTVLIAVLYVNGNGGLEGLPPASRYRILCDSLTIPGMLMLMVGALFAIINAGALDGLGYALSVAFGQLIPGGNARKGERFSDYVERKRQKGVKGYGFLVITGALAMCIAVVFLILYYRAA